MKTPVSQSILSSQAGEGAVGLFSGQSMGKGSRLTDNLESSLSPHLPRRSGLNPRREAPSDFCTHGVRLCPVSPSTPSPITLTFHPQLVARRDSGVLPQCQGGAGWL